MPHSHNLTIVVYSVKKAYALTKRDILKINNLQTDLEAYSVSQTAVSRSVRLKTRLLNNF